LASGEYIKNEKISSYIDNLYDKRPKFPPRNKSLAGQITPKMRTYDMKLYLGTGGIISWGPDCSPQVMSVIRTSLEPLAVPELR
jgi:hypothetical protein